MKELKDYINEALNEAIAIPRKFNTSFTYDDLGLNDKEAEFLKKYLKTDETYQLTEFDENDRKVKQFDKMYDLLNKSKELETFAFNSSTYIAYELPKGTVVVYTDDPYYCGGCFYLSSNKVDE
jgi:regulatory protein YycI of two-component signal transduction system YycFG